MAKTELVSSAYGKYIRVSPRKVRLVIDAVRGERATAALEILNSLNKKARLYVEKVLKSAISNARVNPQASTNELFISKITADKGPVLKRFRAAAMGRATMIRHRTTHLKVELSRHSQIKPKTVKALKKKRQKRKVKK